MSGFRKPPKEYQFKPGQSGNPAGRPVGSVNVKSTLRELANRGDVNRLEAIGENLFRIAESQDNPAAAVSAIREIKLILDGLESQTIVHVSDAVVSTITEWMDCWPISEEARADLVERLKGIA